MAETSLTFLLDKLWNLLHDHVKLISGAENELRLLEDELKLLNGFLEESAKKHAKGELFKQFEKQVREAVYQVEDAIDFHLSKSHRVLPSINPHYRSFAKEVQSLREGKIKNIFDQAKIDFATLRLPDASSTTGAERTKDKLKDPLLRQDNVVGFDGEANTIVKYLNDESEELEVISIIGMPGLGKTTLAWKIFRDSRIELEFPTRIWVYVSHEFDKRDVFLSILNKLTQEDMSKKTDNELAQEVRRRLEKGRFLLVMDDVSGVEAWDDIQKALPITNSWGKVLITTRYANVAGRANRRREPHQLRFLDEKDSWELLQLEIFGNLHDCPSGLEKVGRLIAKNCGGVPLAVVVIGGILCDKYSSTDRIGVQIYEWEKISMSVSTYIKDEPQKRTENIISLSYNKLPQDLRYCFLYLGMFPEDFEIPAWKLIRLWIAEGFVHKKPEKCLEEVAQDNLKDLISRNLVMVDKMKAEGDVKSCRVHDMIREFCKNEAAFENQNLFQEMKKSKERVFDLPVTDIQHCRRLCIHSHVVEYLQRGPKSQHLRSFLCFSKSAIELLPENCQYIPEAFSLLRILDANPIKFTKFPSKLKLLIHLRYIALSGRDLKALPEFISKLWNLQTVRFETELHSIEMKADIWEMRQLRHLKTKAAIIMLNKKGKGDGGENLQTLSRLSPQCCTDEVFDRARNLKTLGIRGQLNTLLDATCFEKLDLLEKLKLAHDVSPDAPSRKPLRDLLQADRFPPNLRILVLTETYLNWGSMSTLGMLGKLEVLKLKENAFVGNRWDAVSGGFLHLEFLYIERTDLQIWTASGDPFPELRSLILRNCEKLEEMPSSLAKSLQMLDIERVAKSLVESAKKIEEGKKKQMQERQRGLTGGFKLLVACVDESTN